MSLEIEVMVWNSPKNVAGLNRLKHNGNRDKKKTCFYLMEINI